MQEQSQKQQSKFIAKIEKFANEIIELVKDTKGASVVLIASEVDLDGSVQNMIAFEGSVNQIVTGLVQFANDQQSAHIFGAAVEVSSVRRLNYIQNEINRQLAENQAQEGKRVELSIKNGKK